LASSTRSRRYLALETREAASRDWDVAAVGVGSAGVVDHDSGRVVSATDALPGWPGIDLRGELSARSGLPVSVDNDVNATALAEARAGAACDARRAILVMVGTGVGGALIGDRNVERGSSGTAGEIGHLPIGPVDGRLCGCGRGGHLEAYTSGPAMATWYRERGGRGAADFRGVAHLARSGDPLALAVVTEGAATLGRALGGLVNVLDPDAVVVGGGVVAAGGVFLRPLRRAYRAELLPGTAGVPMRVSRFGPRSGVIGAGILALDDLRHANRTGG
jgi:glucokinase